MLKVTTSMPNWGFGYILTSAGWLLSFNSVINLPIDNLTISYWNFKIITYPDDLIIIQLGYQS
jgi:hypothetical protein